MLKSLFGGKKRTAKSVNDVRKNRPRAPSTPTDDLEGRIRARRAHNLRVADIKAALASAGPIERPDVLGAVEAAKSVVQDVKDEARQSAVERALRLKGSAEVIDETLSHPARRYLAVAIVRGLLEEGKGGKKGINSKNRSKLQD